MKETRNFKGPDTLDLADRARCFCEKRGIE